MSMLAMKLQPRKAVHHMTGEEIALAQTMWNEGMNARAIANTFGVTPATIYNHCSDGTRHFKKFDASDRVRCLTLRHEGATINAISRMTGWSERTIRKHTGMRATAAERSRALSRSINRRYLQNQELRRQSMDEWDGNYVSNIR